MVGASIIIPALNEEKYIVKTLESARRQKASFNYEVIVADNGSQDRTVELSEKYADKVVTVKRKGIWIGRNTGAEKSRGRVLVFVDADTMIPPNYLEVARAVLEDDEISGLSCSFTFDKRSKLLDTVEELSNSYLVLRGMRGKGEILGFNNAVRRDTFFKAGGFPNQPMEDGAFARRLWKKGRVVYLPNPRVVTSARRILKSGPVHSAVYYANLMLITDFPKIPIEKIAIFKNYLPVR
ncbi:MAG: glycosyltransferase [Candidatus Micrarchaeota archaeon]|nr:glycosyltransferase [Candidatus Micrarchaeota archaeon]